MGASARVCKTFISKESVIQHNRCTDPPNNSEHTNFKPFSPDYSLAEPMQVISNLHQIKDCEFDHEYILTHLEQLEIDPTLCSKCSTANKYFSSSEPFVQDLYRKSCNWRKLLNASTTMDIPYMHIWTNETNGPTSNHKSQVHFNVWGKKNKFDPCLYFNISEKKQLDVPECKMYFEFQLKIR